jgi:putative RNA 2'-phosphotransferase
MAYAPQHRSDVFISKKMSYCLRHNPGKYGLQLDDKGYVDLRDFLAAMNRVHRFDPPLTEQKIRDIMAHSDKQRFAIRDGRICALYGHSLPGHVIRPEAIPPATLYHGTAHRFVSSILREGLLPEGRQYVHLSADIPMARQVGLRRDPHPVIFAVDTRTAHHDGIEFYEGGTRVWLCDEIPARYLTIISS